MRLFGAMVLLVSTLGMVSYMGSPVLSMPALLLLPPSSSPPAVRGASSLIPVTDANWYFSDLNWAHDANAGAPYAQTANPGAYFKLAFTGSTSAGLALDPSVGPKSPYMQLRWSVDGAPLRDVLLPAAGSANLIVLADALNATATHTIQLWIRASRQDVDRWIPSCVLRISGLVVDIGGRLVTPEVQRTRVLVYWDSIGEGVRTLGAHDADGLINLNRSKLLRDDLIDNDSTVTWAMSLAASLNAEISVVAFGRQGYTITGNGNVPPVFTPGNASWSAWSHIDSKHPRVWTTQPDYILSGHGTNDNSAADSLVTAAAAGWLAAVRSVAPRAAIFLTVPFGGMKRAALTAAFKQYQDAGADHRAYLLDLGAPAQHGLDRWWLATAEAVDGIHPWAFRSAQLGGMLAAAVLRLSA